MLRAEKHSRLLSPLELPERDERRDDMHRKISPCMPSDRKIETQPIQKARKPSGLRVILYFGTQKAAKCQSIRRLDGLFQNAGGNHRAELLDIYGCLEVELKAVAIAEHQSKLAVDIQ